MAKECAFCDEDMNCWDCECCSKCCTCWESFS